LSSLINTFAKGRFIEKCMLLTGADSILIIPVKSMGAATDASLQDCANLAAIFTAGAVEADFTGYSRKVWGPSDVVVTFNTTSNAGIATFPNAAVWNPAGGAVNNNIIKVVIAWRPTSGTADSGCLVLATQDYTATAGGGSLTLNVSALTAGGS